MIILDHYVAVAFIENYNKAIYFDSLPHKGMLYTTRLKICMAVTRIIMKDHNKDPIKMAPVCIAD